MTEGFSEVLNFTIRDNRRNSRMSTWSVLTIISVFYIL